MPRELTDKPLYSILTGSEDPEKCYSTYTFTYDFIKLEKVELRGG